MKDGGRSHGPGVDDPIVWHEGSAISNTTRRFLMADERGSVVSVTDSAGATINLNAYDEYGIPAPGNVGKFGYTGQYWVPEAGLWYYKARMYSPTLGRFMQSDPIGYADGMNWYNYVRSDPVNLSDPTGTFGADRGCEWPTCAPTDIKDPNDIVVTGSRAVPNLPTPLGPIAIQGGMPLALAGGTESVSEATEDQKKCPSGSFFTGTDAKGEAICMDVSSGNGKDEEEEKKDWACGIFPDGGIGCRKVTYAYLCSGASQRLTYLGASYLARDLLRGELSFGAAASAAVKRVNPIVAAEIIANINDMRMYCE